MDQDQDDHDQGVDPSELYADSYLVILYLLIFLFLLGIVGYGLCCGIPAFFARYCRCTATRCWGVPCVRVRFDRAAYREERETLQRLRDTRRIQRQQYMDALRVAASQPQGVGVEVFNATPNNIAVISAGQRARAAGLVTSPWAPAELELRRLAYIHAHGGQGAAAGWGSQQRQQQQPPQFSDRASMWAAFHQMNSMGLIIVPQDVVSGQEEEVPFRETLSTEERRAALEEMLEFAPYQGPPKPQDEECGGPKNEACMDNEVNGGCVQADGVERGGIAKCEEDAEDDVLVERKSFAFPENAAEEDAEDDVPVERKSFAFPAHEAPDTAETTCAICLDDFEGGDMLNSQTKCPHRFHQDCLIMWLEHHDICPICRRTMVTESDWREAHGRGANTT